MLLVLFLSKRYSAKAWANFFTCVSKLSTVLWQPDALVGLHLEMNSRLVLAWDPNSRESHSIIIGRKTRTADISLLSLDEFVFLLGLLLVHFLDPHRNFLDQLLHHLVAFSASDRSPTENKIALLLKEGGGECLGKEAWNFSQNSNSLLSSIPSAQWRRACLTL